MTMTNIETERKPYDPTNLPYVVTWLARHDDDHDMTYGLFDSYGQAREFAKSLGFTTDHGGFVVQVVFPPEDHAEARTA